MVLILRDDRETRIELGAGYPARADQVAAQIISRDMLPAFRQGRMSDGIQAGTLAAIDQIARPQAEGRAPTAARRWQDWLPIGIFGAFFAAFALHLGRNALRQHGRRACPQCGSRKLQRHEDYATQTLPGGSPTRMVQTRHTCPDCGWHDQGTMIPVPVSGFSRSEGLRSGGGRSGGFGGGHSGGGGASGRW